MARPTDDPKPLLVTIRLNEADLAHLDTLAEGAEVTRSEVFRRLLRRAKAVPRHSGSKSWGWVRRPKKKG
jgi:hypothetical protein